MPGHSCSQNLSFHNNTSLMASGRHLEEFIQRTLGKILLEALLLQDVSQNSSFCNEMLGLGNMLDVTSDICPLGHFLSEGFLHMAVQEGRRKFRIC